MVAHSPKILASEENIHHRDVPEDTYQFCQGSWGKFSMQFFQIPQRLESLCRPTARKKIE